MRYQPIVLFGLCGLILFAAPSAPQSQQDGGNARPRTPLAEFLASPFVAAFDPLPLTPRPPVPQYAPQAPPGMCRWERLVLDRNGRVLLDPYGQPVKEYAIGSCVAPPH